MDKHISTPLDEKIINNLSAYVDLVKDLYETVAEAIKTTDAISSRHK